jgi:hypothetical protein
MKKGQKGMVTKMDISKNRQKPKELKPLQQSRTAVHSERRPPDGAKGSGQLRGIASDGKADNRVLKGKRIYRPQGKQP